MPQRHNGNPPEKARSSSGNPINRLPAAAQQAAGTVRDMADEAMSNAGQKADDMASSLGGSMKSLAGEIRAHSPDQETLGQLATGVADVLERTGRFLQEEGVSGLAGELNQVIRRYPLSAVFTAVGVGFLLAQTSRR